MQILDERLADLLKRMGSIQRMERGKLCRMSGRPNYNHQTWQNGRNVVRYVKSEHVAPLTEAIEGYRQYMELVQEYADLVIERTRQEIFGTEPAGDEKAKTRKTGSRKKSAARKEVEEE